MNHASALEDQERVQQLNRELVDTLRRIAEPISYMQKNSPSGCKLDGHVALSLVTVAYLQGIAREALLRASDVRR